MYCLTVQDFLKCSGTAPHKRPPTSQSMSELFFVTAMPHWFVRFIIATIRFLEPWATAFVHLDDELCGAPPPPPPSPHLFSIKSHEHSARHTHHKPNYSSSHARAERRESCGMGHGRGTARRSLRSCGPSTTVWSSAAQAWSSSGVGSFLRAAVNAKRARGLHTPSHTPSGWVNEPGRARFVVWPLPSLE